MVLHILRLTLSTITSNSIPSPIHHSTYITIYQPPHHLIPNFIEELDTLLYTLTSTAILTGNINITITSTSHNSRHIYDIYIYI